MVGYISGKEKIPKKGAILFAVNHPNALLDPLFVTTFNPRENHFLVRADVFKKPLIKKALATLNLMPIYRIRDGRKQLSNNEEIFKKCFSILKKKQTLIIFPQGGHCRDRSIQPLSKGFTRIVFGAIEENPDLQIAVIPVGVTYQNSSVYPCKVAVNFGDAIQANEIFNSKNKPDAINSIKEEVSNQLKKLTVHIPKKDNYQATLQKLNDANVDFTEVNRVNKLIEKNTIPNKIKKPFNFLKPLFYLILINSIIPYFIWKKQKNSIKEKEFIDTMRFGICMLLFPIFYLLQSIIISSIFTTEVGIKYLVISVFSILVYTKFSPVNTEN